MALANAQCTTNDVDYISAYGPGHPVLDAAEVNIIKGVFGQRSYSLPVSSIKQVTGKRFSRGRSIPSRACALNDSRSDHSADCEL